MRYSPASFKASVLTALEYEKALTAGRALGLSDEQTDEAIKAEALHSYHSPDPFDWRRVHRNLIEKASQP